MRFLLGTLLSTALGGVNSSSLRGIPSTANDRDLAATDEVHFRCTLDPIEEVETGGPCDNDNGPSEETVTCTETSMVAHMDKIAEMFINEMEGYTPTGGEHWVDSVMHAQGKEEIKTTLKTDIFAKLKVFIGGVSSKRRNIDLNQHPILGGHRARKLQTTAAGDETEQEAGYDEADKSVKKMTSALEHENEEPSISGDIHRPMQNKKKNRKKKKRKKRRMFSLNDKVHCELCLSDNMDGGRLRRLRALAAISSFEPNFEVWMNDRICEEIVKDCAEIAITSTTFSRIENGSVTHTSGPSPPLPGWEEPLAEDGDDGLPRDPGGDGGTHPDDGPPSDLGVDGGTPALDAGEEGTAGQGPGSPDVPQDDAPPTPPATASGPSRSKGQRRCKSC